MAEHSDQTAHFAALFETITGQSTTTERQQTDSPVRLKDQHAERTIAADVAMLVTNDGLDDVIEEPETG